MGFSLSALFGRGKKDGTKKPGTSVSPRGYSDPLAVNPLAPGPTGQPPRTAVPRPDDPFASAPLAPKIVPGADQAQAALAGQRQRRRAMQGALMARPLLKSKNTQAKPAFKAKALIGY